MNDVLFKNFGIEKTDEIFKQASYLAECEFAKNALPLDVDESTFISTLVQTLETLKVGILRLENLVLLKVKLGSISRSLEEQLSNTSIEQLDELTVNILNINSEEDVMKLLH